MSQGFADWLETLNGMHVIPISATSGLERFTEVLLAGPWSDDPSESRGRLQAATDKHRGQPCPPSLAPLVSARVLRLGIAAYTRFYDIQTPTLRVNEERRFATETQAVFSARRHEDWASAKLTSAALWFRSAFSRYGAGGAAAWGTRATCQAIAHCHMNHGFAENAVRGAVMECLEAASEEAVRAVARDCARSAS